MCLLRGVVGAVAHVPCFHATCTIKFNALNFFGLFLLLRACAVFTVQALGEYISGCHNDIASAKVRADAHASMRLVRRINLMWFKLLHSGFETCFAPSSPFHAVVLLQCIRLKYTHAHVLIPGAHHGGAALQAGLRGIFVSQQNDFALGLPLLASM